MSKPIEYGRPWWEVMNELAAENARLKAEVERLTAQVSYDNRTQLHVDKLAAEFTQCEVEKLKAENERLRKAGDAMLLCLTAYVHGVPYKIKIVSECSERWIEAKEGKQS